MLCDDLKGWYGGEGEKEAQEGGDTCIIWLTYVVVWLKPTQHGNRPPIKKEIKKKRKGEMYKQTETPIVKRGKLSHLVRIAESNRKKKDAWQEVSQSKARSSFIYHRPPSFLSPL